MKGGFVFVPTNEQKRTGDVEKQTQPSIGDAGLELYCFQSGCRQTYNSNV